MFSNNIMPSRKKKSKAKGRKPAAGGKGGGAKGADNAAANEGTLDSEMQRLKIGEQKGDDDEVEAMLEEAIKLAAVEEQEMKVKEKENCTHGYNPSSRFQARFCEDFLKTFTESYYASTRGNSRIDRLRSVNMAFQTAITTSIRISNASRKNLSNAESVNPFCLAEGAKFILDGKSDDARLPALLALTIKSTSTFEWPDHQKMLELLCGDQHTLVQFFRKRIPCSCLDEKYKEVKSITKLGVCFNNDCPQRGHMIRSKMLKCTGCHNDRCVSYCSRACQEAHWPMHKKYCGKTVTEVSAMHFNDM
jgi:hypothetical protein